MPPQQHRMPAYGSVRRYNSSMSPNLFIVGNWKMNPRTLEEAKEIFSGIRKSALRAKHVHVIIAPPAPFIFPLASKKGPIAFGIQDIATAAGGAHTGGISADMARSVGVHYAIVGHSECRAAGDTDEVVAEKFLRAVEARLIPILCVGEKKRDQDGDYFSEISRQIASVLKPATKIRAPRFIVAYEPVWAVGGSYDSALSPEEMRAMAIFIKKTCAQYISKEKAMKLGVLYGGSVSSDNAPAMLREGGINGLLIGRQSLDPERFAEIIKLARA